MTKLVINGHLPLDGDVELSGDQQTIMAIQAASILSTQGTVIVDNVPATANIVAMNQLLQSLNVVINFDRHRRVLKMDATRQIEPVKLSGQAMLATGAVLARCRQVQLVDNGMNPEFQKIIAQSSSLLQQLGAQVEQRREFIDITANQLTGCRLNLQSATLTTTLSMMMVATMAQGITVLEHPGDDPSIIELAKVLNKMGARVHGAGTDTIRIQGVNFLHSTDYYALDDQEEAGTYLILGAVTAGDILVRGAQVTHLKPLIDHLNQMGNTVVVQRNGIRVIGTKLLLPVDIQAKLFQQAGAYLQMALTGLQMAAQGNTIIHGFKSSQMEVLSCVIADQEQQVQFKDHQLTINGPIRRYPSIVTTTSPAAGLLALLNALVAHQTTTINPAEVAGGSFVHLLDQLIELGAQIDLSFE